MTAGSDVLFHKGDLSATLDNALRQAVREVASLDADYLLRVSETDLVAALVERRRVCPVVIRTDDIHVEGPREVDVDVTGDIRHWHGRGGRTLVPGSEVTVVVPFDGDPTIFQLRPQRWSTMFPRGNIRGHELLLEYRGVELQGEALKKQYEDELRRINEHLSWGHDQIETHNKRLEEEIKKAVTARKQRLRQDQGVVESLGLPLKRREVPETYSVPVTRRKPKVEMPKASEKPFRPEPALAEEEYDQILGIMQNMALAMERSPRTFAKLDEEEIRDHFLVHLNGHYEGQATGETFNYEGKTDILIRHEGRNIFIAECKFWKGEKGLLGTIDQLLGYTCWRDTKTAIVLFNRTKNFSKVLAQMPEAVTRHPNCKKDLGQKGETQFRYLFHHRDDKNRELIITVLAFDVPSPEEGAAQAAEDGEA